MMADWADVQPEEVCLNGNLVGVRGFEPPASWSQTMRASRCATPRNWRIYHSGEGKSKVSSLSTTLTGGTTAGPEGAMLNHLTLTGVVQTGGSGDTPDPNSILLHRLPSFPRRRESSSRDSPQPSGPQSWGSEETKRGFAPLFAPMRIIGETELVCDALKLPGARQLHPTSSRASVLPALKRSRTLPGRGLGVSPNSYFPIPQEWGPGG